MLGIYSTNNGIHLRFLIIGQREITPARLQAKPNGDDKLLRKVVKGMLPKNKLGAKLLGNMYVYAGSEHKHDAQNPKMIDINVLK